MYAGKSSKAGGNMEKIVAQGMLYDFYGELLTEHQKNIYEDFVYHDLSLSEIATEYHISRQGVHDLIRRCDHLLQGYEDKLHLIDRFTKIRDKISEIQQLSEQPGTVPEELARNIRQLSGDILNLI